MLNYLRICIFNKLIPIDDALIKDKDLKAN